MTSQVPKLNLTPVLQQREEEQGSQQAYKVAPAAPEPKPQTKSQSKPPEEPMDHYYYYPKLDSKVGPALGSLVLDMDWNQ